MIPLSEQIRRIEEYAATHVSGPTADVSPAIDVAAAQVSSQLAADVGKTFATFKLVCSSGHGMTTFIVGGGDGLSYRFGRKLKGRVEPSAAWTPVAGGLTSLDNHWTIWCPTKTCKSRAVVTLTSLLELCLEAVQHDERVIRVETSVVR